MGLEELRKRQEQKARNWYWKPTEQDGFRVIIFRRIETQKAQDGREYPVILGYEATSLVPFRMPYYRHIAWQVEEDENAHVQFVPGGIYSILFTGVGEARNQQEAFQFWVEQLDLGELEGIDEKQAAAIRQVQAQVQLEEEERAKEEGSSGGPRGRAARQEGSEAPS